MSLSQRSHSGFEVEHGPLAVIPLERLKIQEHRQLQQTARSKWPQHVAAVLATLAALCSGSVQGWTAPALPYLQQGSWNSTNSTPPVTEMQGSWIGSIAALGGLVGAIPAGYLADHIGRKPFLLLLGAPYLVGWILIVLGDRCVPMLYASRFVSGMAMGATTVVTPMYNEEIAEDSVRGVLGVYLDLMVTVGILWSYVLGTFVPYEWLALSSALLPCIFTLTFLWMPESPVYLLTKGRPEEAEKSLRWLRNAHHLQDSAVKWELADMQQLIDETRARNNLLTNKRRTLRRLLSRQAGTTPAVRCFLLVLGLMFFQQMSGINAVLFYAAQIFESAGSSFPPLLCTVIVGCVQVLATYLAALLVDVAGRRVLLLLSDGLMALCLSLLALDAYVKDYHSLDDVDIGWVPLFAVTVYMIAFSVGFGPLPWLLMAELAPTESKGIIGSAAVFLNYSLAFAVTNVFESLIAYLGATLAYSGFSLLSVLGTIFVYYCIPETKGKSRQQIQQELSGK